MRDDLLKVFEEYGISKKETAAISGGGICTSKCTHRTSTWDTVTDTDYDDGRGGTTSDKTLLGGMKDILDFF